MDLINKQFDSTKRIFSSFNVEQDAADGAEVKAFPSFHFSKYKKHQTVSLQQEPRDFELHFPLASRCLAWCRQDLQAPHGREL